MMLKIFFVLISILIGICSADVRHYDGYSVVRLYPRTVSQLKYLKDLADKNIELDFWTYPSSLRHPVDVMIPPSVRDDFEKILLKKKFVTKALIPNVESIISEQRKHSKEVIPGFFSNYQRLNTIFSFLEAINSENPMITSIERIGSSTENRDLRLIKIGINQEYNNKSIVFIDGGIHAREWISPATVCYFIEKLIDGYNSNDPEIVGLLQKFDFYILPVVNPDGYEFTHIDDRLWRKTRSQNVGSTCIGTDANRNFDLQWGTVGVSTNPCSATYGGPRAVSEPEVQALSNYILARKDRIKIYLNVHSYSQLWLSPWGYTNTLPNDFAAMDQKGRIAATALSSIYGTQYTVGNSIDVLYATSGSAQDWGHGGAGIKYSYTVELRDTGAYGFLLPPSQIIPSGIETSAAFIAIAKSVAEEL